MFDVGGKITQIKWDSWVQSDSLRVNLPERLRKLIFENQALFQIR